jgi:hypothetical protein
MAWWLDAGARCMPNGHDKNWRRLCAAIDGFRARYERWPTRVLVHPRCLADIRDRLLTSEDYESVCGKVSLIEDDGPMIAEDDLGNRFSYGNEEMPKERPTPGASDWLAVSPRQ